jgi:hypothetical protein
MVKHLQSPRALFLTGALALGQKHGETFAGAAGNFVIPSEVEESLKLLMETFRVLVSNRHSVPNAFLGGPALSSG